MACVLLARPWRMCFSYPLVLRVSRNVARTHFINCCLDNSLGTAPLVDASWLPYRSIALGHHESSWSECYLSDDFISPFVKYSPHICCEMLLDRMLVLARQGLAFGAVALFVIAIESLPLFKPTRDAGPSTLSARYSS